MRARREDTNLPNQEPRSIQPVHKLKPYKRVQGTHQIERFFRVAAGLDLDKEDIRRYYDFVDEKVSDLLLMAQHTARANERVKVDPRDLPITKGLQENIHDFRKLDIDIGVEAVLNQSLPEPQMGLPYSEETEARLPDIAGGLTLAIARTFKIIDPDLKHPATREWEKAFRMFNQLL
jgi:hypothetical protein